MIPAIMGYTFTSCIPTSSYNSGLDSDKTYNNTKVYHSSSLIRVIKSELTHEAALLHVLFSIGDVPSDNRTSTKG